MERSKDETVRTLADLLRNRRVCGSPHYPIESLRTRRRCRWQTLVHRIRIARRVKSGTPRQSRRSLLHRLSPSRVGKTQTDEPLRRTRVGVRNIGVWDRVSPFWRVVFYTSPRTGSQDQRTRDIFGVISATGVIFHMSAGSPLLFSACTGSATSEVPISDCECVEGLIDKALIQRRPSYQTDNCFLSCNVRRGWRITRRIWPAISRGE